MGGEPSNGSILGSAQKLIIPAFVAIILGLIGVVWTLINGQMNELRTDIRVLQTKNDEQASQPERADAACR